LLADEDDPVARWETILASRSALFAEVADIVFDTSTGPLSGVVSDIVAWVHSLTPGDDSPAEERTRDALSEGTK
jgi:shikimate kinase